VKQGAESAYIHAIRDPGYFQNLYFSNSWGNWETQNLDIYLQYSDLRTSAEAFIFQGEDIYAARIMRTYVVNGDTEKAARYLEDIASVGGFGLLSLPFKDPGLAEQVKSVVESIDMTGNPPPGVRQGNFGVFRNREGLLPQTTSGWIESDIFPGFGPRGGLRIVMEQNGRVYFTNNHYFSGSFVQIR